jgi:Protein of unknown function (DUF2844)
VFLLTVQAFAALGGDVSSVQADQVHINASLRSMQMPAYTIHELRSPGGMLVREFASTGGRVFAVSWKGPSPPDLRQLLGSHFEDFQQAMEAQGARRTHGPLSIEQKGLVVQLGGHMRSYAGHAYLSDQVPMGVRADDLR